MAEKGSDRLRIGVLVDLEWTPDAGGHVKCWERFAAAATGVDDLDLTVHFFGAVERTVEISANARYVLLPPVLDTRRFRFLDHCGGHTDLALCHRGLAARLGRFDVVHATSFFSFGRTALKVTRRTGQPLVASLHSDLPRLTRAYAAEIVRRAAGEGWGSRILLDGLGLDRLSAAVMEHRLRRALTRCARVLVSKPEDRERVSRLLPADRVSRLRRGIDTAIFHPGLRDRRRLAEAFGIPPERPVLLFAGRADQSKSVMTAAWVVRRLLDRNLDVHLIVAGDGRERGTVGGLLGDRVSLPGTVDQGTLAWLYASAEVFVFPSQTEVAPNVVLEAQACGLPVVVAGAHGGGPLVDGERRRGLVVEDPAPEAWADAIADLVEEPEKRAAMSRAARRHVQDEGPTWRRVLLEDLLPVWRDAASGRQRAAACVTSPSSVASCSS